MTGNNEVGTIEPITQIGELLRKKGIAFHTDAVQAVGQIPLSMRHLPVDFLSASAHKFHGPKGVGFLYVRNDQDLPSFIHGGSQERGKRAGTENVAGIVGMAEALAISAREMAAVRPRLVQLRRYFIGRVMREIPNVRLNGHPVKRLPGNVNFAFRDVDATSLLVLLEEDGICASAGSACNTGQTRLSHVIEALGVPEEYAPGSVRFTMGRETTKAQVDVVIESLKRSVSLLRQR
jgi:cysteine desulfurase